MDADQKAAEKQQAVRRAAEEVERLRREGAELLRDGKPEEALARLAQAEKAAEVLELAAQQQVAEQIKRIRAEQNERAERTARRPDASSSGLAEGKRLLDAGKAAEARHRVRARCSRSTRGTPRALEGKRDAEEHILAETTQQERDAAFRSGRRCSRPGQYEQALQPLTDAAADPTNREAAALLERAQQDPRAHAPPEGRARPHRALLAEGERLIAARPVPGGRRSSSGSALELDPGHTLRARAPGPRRAHDAARQMFEKSFPNQPPVLTFLETPPQEVEGRTLALLGVATDDRGLARVEYRAGTSAWWPSAT